MKHTEDPFDLAIGSVDITELGPSDVLYYINRVSPPNPEELSDQELSEVIDELREPFERLRILVDNPILNDEITRAIRRITNHHKNRITARLIPRNPIRPGKRRKKAKNFILKARSIQQQLRSVLTQIGEARVLGRALHYIGERINDREDIITDIHLLAGFQLEEHLHSEMEGDGVAIRAKCDQSLIRTELLAEDSTVFLQTETAREHILKLVGKVSRKKPRKEEINPQTIMNNYQLRNIYMDAIKGFMEPMENFAIALETLLKEASEQNDYYLLNDLMIICQVMLDNLRERMEPGLYNYYFQKFQRLNVGNYLDCDEKKKESIEDLVLEFITDYGDKLFIEGEHNRNRQRWFPEIEAIDFKKIAEEGESDWEKERE